MTSEGSLQRACVGGDVGEVFVGVVVGVGARVPDVVAVVGVQVGILAYGVSLARRSCSADGENLREHVLTGDHNAVDTCIRRA